jgi:hypothetical protein
MFAPNAARRRSRFAGAAAKTPIGIIPTRSSMSTHPPKVRMIRWIGRFSRRKDRLVPQTPSRAARSATWATKKTAQPATTQISVNRHRDLGVTGRGGTVELSLRHSNDAIGGNCSQKQRTIPVDALHIGADLCVRYLPKEPQTAVMGVETEEMSFYRPSILLI